MRHLLIISILLAVFALPALAQPELTTPPVAKEKVRQEAVQREQEAKDRDLKAENWPDGDLAVLNGMTAADIVKMQIFALEQPPNIIHLAFPQKRYLTHHFGTERRTELEAVLALTKRAPKYSIPAGMALKPLPPDRTLVVQPAKGEPFEFLYNADLDAPFAGVYSRELKEALYASSEITSRLSIIQLDGNKVLRTINTYAIPPHRGGMYSQELAVELRLTPENGLTLYLKLRDGDRKLLETEQPVRYGEATIFPSPGLGQIIVLLQKP